MTCPRAHSSEWQGPGHCLAILTLIRCSSQPTGSLSLSPPFLIPHLTPFPLFFTSGLLLEPKIHGKELVLLYVTGVLSRSVVPNSL